MKKQLTSNDRLAVIRESVAGIHCGTERRYCDDAYADRQWLLVELDKIRRAANEPVAEPVAYRKFIDSAYERYPRYTFREDTGIGAPEGWEPLYTRPSQSPGLLRDNERHAIWNVLQFCKANPSMATGIDWTARKLLQELYDRSGITK